MRVRRCKRYQEVLCQTPFFFFFLSKSRPTGIITYIFSLSEVGRFSYTPATTHFFNRIELNYSSLNNLLAMLRYPVTL